jgi:hypothetical protein
VFRIKHHLGKQVSKVIKDVKNRACFRRSDRLPGPLPASARPFGQVVSRIGEQEFTEERDGDIAGVAGCRFEEGLRNFPASAATLPQGCETDAQIGAGIAVGDRKDIEIGRASCRERVS